MPSIRMRTFSLSLLPNPTLARMFLQIFLERKKALAVVLVPLLQRFQVLNFEEHPLQRLKKGLVLHLQRPLQRVKNGISLYI